MHRFHIWIIVVGFLSLMIAASLFSLQVLGQSASSLPAWPAAELNDCSQVCQDADCRSGFSLPPIMITDTLWIYPETVCACPSPDPVACPYLFEGTGTFFLPNMDTSGPGVKARFKLCTENLAFDAALEDLQPQCLHLTSTVRMPVGDSGLCLTSLEGQITFEEGTTPSSVNLTGTFELCEYPELMGANGDLYVSLEAPYTLTATGAVSILTWEAAQMAVSVTQGSGLEASGTISMPYCSGQGNLHVWMEGDTVRFTGYTEATCEIPAGEFDDYRPQWWIDHFPDVHLPQEAFRGQATCQVGELCSTCAAQACSSQVMGAECCFSTRIGFESSALRNWRFDDELTICFLSGQDGLVDVHTNLESCERQGPTGTERQSLHTYTVPYLGEDALWILTWPAGKPEIRLFGPNGESMTNSDHIAISRRDRSATILLRDAEPGNWLLQVEGLPPNEPLTLQIPCGTNEAPNAEILAPVQSGDPTQDGQYVIRWRAEDIDDEAQVYLYYDRDNQGYDGTLIAECLAESTTSWTWDTRFVPSGDYFVYLRVTDGYNRPLLQYSEGTVRVANTTAPSQPGGLIINTAGQSSYLNLSWTANPEPDIAGYKIYTGPMPGLYKRVYEVTNLLYYRLPRYTDSRYVGLLAYDHAGNTSPLTVIRPSVIRMPLLLK
jgi:hypothetical protein